MSGWYYPPPQPTQFYPKVLPSNGGSPPFRQLVPIVCKDPQRPIYGLDWQYGFTWRSGQTSQGVAQGNANNPPGSVFGASGAAAPDFAAFGLYVDTWTAPAKYPVAAIRPIPVVNNPPITSFAGLYALRVSWPEPTWPVVYGGPQGIAGITGIVSVMPFVIGLDLQVGIALIAQVGGIGFKSGQEDTVYPQQPLPKNIILRQSPAAGTLVSGTFFAPLSVSSGLMKLPDVGDSVANPPNKVIGSTDQ